MNRLPMCRTTVNHVVKECEDKYLKYENLDTVTKMILHSYDS